MAAKSARREQLLQLLRSDQPVANHNQRQSTMRRIKQAESKKTTLERERTEMGKAKVLLEEAMVDKASEVEEVKQAIIKLQKSLAMLPEDPDINDDVLADEQSLEDSCAFETSTASTLPGLN